MSREVAIVGAGPAGLAAARWLLAQGFEPLLLEAADGVGGQWRQTNPLSGVWPGMPTNTSRLVTRFSDLDYPPGTAVFPHNREVLAHLEAYAETFGLGQRLRTGATVERLVVPFAMPLLIGPGAISATIIYAGEAKGIGWEGTLAGLAAMAAVAVCTFVTFMLTPIISRVLGRIGMTITVRVAGLILCAMAVQFLIVGLNDATHGLVRQSVASPYAEAPARR